MPRPFRWLAAAALLATPSAVHGQITWSVTYSDPAGSGFNSTTAAGSTTLGQLRKDSVTAATSYLGSILDGRGTVRLNWDVSGTSGTGALASFGSDGLASISNGNFQNGAVYQRARTNTGPFSLTVDGSGSANFGYSWHYGVTGSNTALTSTTTDFISVITHEIGHALGISALSDYNVTSASDTSQLGKGLNAAALGSPDGYSMFDKGLQRGNTANANAMFAKTVTSPTYGSYNTAIATTVYTSGNSQSGSTVTNNTASGLYFGGTYTNEVFGGPVPIYAPTTYAPGSTASHVNAAVTSTVRGLMNYNIGRATERRLQGFERAMLLDLGWNVYNWDNARANPTGNWLDGVSTLANSRWTTDSGIVLADDGFTRYNVNAAQAEAPVLPVYGQVTADIVLNFRGSGTQNYVSTNNNDAATAPMRTARVNLNSTSTNTITIAGGLLNFGMNADGSPSVIPPKIVQQNSGAFVISSALRTSNTTGFVAVYNVNLPGATGLTVDGTGTGPVTLSGSIQGTGTLTKAGVFTLTVSGTASTFSGGTTVNAGNLMVANNVGAVNTGSALGTGPLTVNSAATLSGTGAFTGAATVASGGFLTAGTSGVAGDRSLDTGALTVAGRFNVVFFATGLLGNSLVNVAGDLNLTSSTDSLAIVLNGVTADALRAGGAQSFTVMTFTGTRVSNATFDTTDFTSAGFTADEWSLSYSSNTVTLNFTPVPEPAHLLLVGVALAGVRRLRRRL